MFGETLYAHQDNLLSSCILTSINDLVLEYSPGLPI